MSSSTKSYSLDGIILLNKPINLTSNAALQKVKRLYDVKKAGHTGSLDPLATGMLPICLGQATKVCQYLLSADKVYRAVGRLGIKTDTADATGAIIAQKETFYIDEVDLLEVLKQFIGDSLQIPSMFSALKYQGTALYKLARQGKTVERQARSIHISKLQLLNFNGVDFEIEVHCTKGTYIRNLVEDIGEQLGVYAHVIELHRVHTAGFANQPMYHLHELEAFTPAERIKIVLPLDHAVTHFPRVDINAEQLCNLQQGKVIQCGAPPGLTRLYSADCYCGLGDVSENGELRVQRLMAF